jgi:hypothetical protein
MDTSDWTSKCAHAITSTNEKIIVHVPCTQGILTICHELDQQKRFHTNIALYVMKDDGQPGAFIHSFYRHPNGEVIGPIFRD